MELLVNVSNQLGVSLDQLKLVLLLFLSVPLSLVFPYLPSSTTSVLPHLFSALPSVVFLWTVLHLRSGFFQLLGSSLLTWVIVKRGIANKEGKAMPWKVFAVAMGHLTINHIYRHLAKTSTTEVEITGSQMVLCMKLISFAWSVYDGNRPIADLDATQRGSRIEAVPGLIPFLGYCFFFPSILAGPSFTYASYDNFTSRALFRKEVTDKSSAVVIPPGRRRKASKRLLTGVCFLAIYSLYGAKADYKNMLAPGFELNPFGYRFLFINVAGFLARTKYYAVWCIAESAFILSGMGYNPATTKYDASRNVRIRSIEFAPNFKILFDSWNMNTNVWLRECIYKRVTKTGKKPGFKSTQITFITSALWHGVNPCYLMTFILGGFLQSLNRSLRTLLRPFFLPPGSISLRPSHTAPPTSASTPIKKLTPPAQTLSKYAYDASGILATQFALNFTVAPFMLLEVGTSLAVWKSVGWYGLYMTFLPILFFTLGGSRLFKGQLKSRDARFRKKEERESDEREKRERVVWELEEERKRVRRGEGVASMALDVEEMADEEDEK